METLNKNWFAITLTAVVFGLLGFLLGKQGKKHHSCSMMNGHHEMMFMGDGPRKMMNGKNMIMFKTDEGEVMDLIEDIDVQKEEGDNGEQQIKIKVKTKKE